MKNISVDEGHRESPARCVDLAADLVFQHHQVGGSSIHSDGAGGGCVSPATLVSTCEGFRTVGAAAVGASDGGRRISDAEVSSVSSVSDACAGLVKANAVTRAGQYPVPGRTAERNRRIAGHEIGHALLMRVLSDRPIAFVEITRRDGFEGRACGADYEESHRNLEDQTGIVLDGCARIEKMTPGLGSNRIESAELYVKAQTMVIELVAGSIAESILFPDLPPLRAEHDKIEARAVAAIACASSRSVDAMLAYAECEAENLIRENLGAVVALVDALVDSKDGKLTGIEVDAVIVAAISHETLKVELKRRVEWTSAIANAAKFSAGLESSQLEY
jgi:hypothetical protein